MTATQYQTCSGGLWAGTQQGGSHWGVPAWVQRDGLQILLSCTTMLGLCCKARVHCCWKGSTVGARNICNRLAQRPRLLLGDGGDGPARYDLRVGRCLSEM